MDAHIQRVMQECTKGSDDERLTFPQVVNALMEAGVERYHADLQRGDKTYYMPNGESLTVATRHIDSSPARDFSAADIESAVREIQAQKLTYKAFCERIAEAGCVGYLVSLVGRRAVYFGRSADTYVEPFPGSTSRKSPTTAHI